MALHLLTARQVQTAKEGLHNDGGGLALHVTGTGASWVWRYTSPVGRRRDAGLGRAERSTLAAAGESLARARKAAAHARGQLDQDIDPLDKRDADRAAKQQEAQAKKEARQAEHWTLARWARRYHEQTVEPRRTVKHGKQWIASLEQGVPAELWHKPIDKIEPPELLEALAALQMRVPETCRRVRQRLEAVFADAEFHKACTSNPARVIKPKLAERPVGRAKAPFAALPFADVPAFVKALWQQPGIAALAAEFTLLVAARTSETLGATWAEIDTHAGVWTVPGARMKAGEPHAVHLSPRALQIIEQARELQGDPWVFPSPVDRKKPMSNMAMLTLLRRMGLDKTMTIHGLRSSFSTWANELGMARSDVIEACLAHREQDRIRAAYNRASFAAERRALLNLWSRFCGGEQVAAQSAPVHTAQVVQMPVAA